jgi:hypothetical protein
LLAVSLTESVTLVLKIFPAIRLLAGVAVKVVSLPDATGAADILIQVVKLSEDSSKLPEQVVLSVFVVMELVNIFLLNVTATVVDTETLVELSVGLTEETLGRLSYPYFS